MNSRTDRPHKYFFRKSGWKIKSLGKDHLSKLNVRLLSRYPKILSHMFFAAPPKNPLLRIWKRLCGLKYYDYTIYIDGNAQILTNDFAQEVIGYLKERQIAMFIHPERDCIYDEAAVLINDTRFKGKEYPFQKQVDSYRMKGYPKHNGLLACGIIVRNSRLKLLPKIENDWWKEVNKWTYRDQLSLPYVLWRNKYECAKINLNLWENHLIKFFPHNVR